MVINMDHGLPNFSLLGYDDWKIMMEAHLYALHDCMWMVLEDGPLKIRMENLERNPTSPDVVQYIPKPKEKWDDRDCKKHNLDNVVKAAIFKTLDPITFSKIKHLKTAMEIWQGLGKLCEGSEDLRKQKIEVLLEKFKSFKMLLGESFDMLDERFHKILNDLASLNHILSPKEKNVRKPGHWKSACPYPKVEKYGERERNEKKKKKKAMVAAESDDSSSSSSGEEALVCIERRTEKSNHEDRWTMLEDDTLCLMAKDDADQEPRNEQCRKDENDDYSMDLSLLCIIFGTWGAPTAGASISGTISLFLEKEFARNEGLPGQLCYGLCFIIGDYGCYLDSGYPAAIDLGSNAVS
ncbi:unnamed protein product [Cuscuta campestris]|uniref:DUF4219 domain-containing protein n=1 Tax=Cuscuta campestris TaxID=132261 RepID=A0A484M2Z3_9ASTE|nr:unnamed protein product [Cuscuta campestris]